MASLVKIDWENYTAKFSVDFEAAMQRCSEIALAMEEEVTMELVIKYLTSKSYTIISPEGEIL